MKRIMFFLMIAAIMAMSCTLFSSCREEGHTIELTNDYVSGTWDVTWMEIDGEGMYTLLKVLNVLTSILLFCILPVSA